MTRAERTDTDLLARWDVVVDAVTQTQRRIADDIEQSGIPAPWFAALRALLHADGHRLPMTHLARIMSISSGGFTKLADRMGRQGLIDRRNSSGDRRVVYAMLTPDGVQVATRAEQHYLAAIREHVLLPLSAEELLHISDTLRPLGASSEPVEVDTDLDAEAGAAVIEPRDPSLPDRRHRGD